VANELVKKSTHEAIERERKLLDNRLDRAEIAVADVERLLGIRERWKSSDDEYQSTLKYIDNKKFVRTAEEIEGLVVSRLMELEKANVSGLGLPFFHCLSSQLINNILRIQTPESYITSPDPSMCHFEECDRYLQQACTTTRSPTRTSSLFRGCREVHTL
jgi:hypothetical protein